jgi:hypothetical protein
MRRLRVRVLIAGLLLGIAALAGGANRFGENVYVFNSRMPVAEIQRVVDRIAKQQLDNQFGVERYALLFEPGTYGSRDRPLIFQVGYYTAVAGLGLKPTDVIINGSVQVRNRCFNGACVALDNFWRSLSNLTVKIESRESGCYAGEIWAASQAAPVRRVRISGGDFRLSDNCSAPSHASGGFIADSEFDGRVINGTQQQFMIRNSRLQGWSNGNWNQLFSGVIGAPSGCQDGVADCAYLTLAESSVSREAPVIYVDSRRRYRVLVPPLRSHTSGTSWQDPRARGASVPIGKFHIATPADSVDNINAALRQGLSLLLTPGVYHIARSILISHPDTVVIGLGFATLIAEDGAIPLVVTATHGVSISGIIVEAGAISSPELLRIGDTRNSGALAGAADPTSLHDVFFRIGGAHIGRSAVSLVVNSDHVILDHIWAWRADHGEGVGWNLNTADTGVVVHGDSVTAHGLFVEHYQKEEVLWDGDDGTVVFFQNEMPYDVPDAATWHSSVNEPGFPAFKLADTVRHFHGYGMGSYSYFNQGVPIYADAAFQVPATLDPSSLRDLFTIFLNPTASGGIWHVVNQTGGSATAANPDVAVRVSSYP